MLLLTHVGQHSMAPQQFGLPDGRKVDYLVSGAQDGFPMVFIHGTPGACLVDPTMRVACEEKGIKVITMSRAGYGGSTRNRGRRVVDVVGDVQALLEHLGIEKWVAGGWSGGGKTLFVLSFRPDIRVPAIL